MCGSKPMEDVRKRILDSSSMEGINMERRGAKSMEDVEVDMWGY